MFKLILLPIELLPLRNVEFSVMMNRIITCAEVWFNIITNRIIICAVSAVIELLPVRIVQFNIITIRIITCAESVAQVYYDLNYNLCGKCSSILLRIELLHFWQV